SSCGRPARAAEVSSGESAAQPVQCRLSPSFSAGCVEFSPAPACPLSRTSATTLTSAHRIWRHHDYGHGNKTPQNQYAFARPQGKGSDRVRQEIYFAIALSRISAGGATRLRSDY